MAVKPKFEAWVKGAPNILRLFAQLYREEAPLEAQTSVFRRRSEEKGPR